MTSYCPVLFRNGSSLGPDGREKDAVGCHGPDADDQQRHDGYAGQKEKLSVFARNAYRLYYICYKPYM